MALTDRQKQILRLISQQLQVKEIARALNISERTVKAHTDAARKRLGVATSREAARLLAAFEASEKVVPDGRWPSGPMDEPNREAQASPHAHAVDSERNAQPSAGQGTDSVHDRRDSSPADRGWAGFEGRLARLNAIQWLGLIAIVGVLAAILTSGLIAASLGTLEAIESLRRQVG